MPLNPEYKSKIAKLAGIVAIEASHKLAFLINKNSKINFNKVSDSIIIDNKFSIKKNCFLLNYQLEKSELGSINILISNEVIQCVADLAMGGSGMVEDNVQPDETNQTVFENTAKTLIEAILDRLNNLQENLNLKITEHKQRQLLKHNPTSLSVSEDLTDTLALNFTFKITSRLDTQIDIELKADLVNFIIEQLLPILESLDLEKLEEKIKNEYCIDDQPHEEKPLEVVEEKYDPSKEINELRNFSFIKDINLDLIVELGRVQMPFKDILTLTKGSAIELDRSTNQPVDLFVHNQLVARGEVVAIDECFGLKVTEVLGNLDLNSLMKQKS